MATDKKKSGTITNGMKLTVIVEETINDVIVVVLEHANKVYRGVLINASKRNVPPGICSAFNNSTSEELEDCTDGTLGNPLPSNKPVDMSASVFRHTYFPNMANLGAHVPVGLDRSFPKLGSNKPRNIRLRPRQTLCSNCKSTCLDSQNGPIPVTSALTTSASYSQLQGMKQLANTQSSSKASVKSEIKSFKKKSTASDIEPKPTKLIKVHSDSDMNSKFTKTSPYIKISIGDTNVMNIPPRIHEMDRQVPSDAERSAEDDEHGDDDRGLKTSPYKRMLRRSFDGRNSSDESRSRRNSPSSKDNRTKKMRRKSKDYDESDGDMPTNIIITENVDTSEDSEDFVESSENSKDYKMPRPRLVYTWKHNKGLSPMKHSNSNESLASRKSDSSCELAPGPLENLDGTSLQEPKVNKRKKGSVKKYKLRSRSRSLDSNPEYEITEDSAYVSYEDPRAVSDRSDGCSPEDETTSDSDNSDYGDGPPGDDQVDAFKPLMMKIHTHTVSKCNIPDGRKLETGDIVWGKVKGFPWWPGRIMTISVSEKDNSVVIRQIAQVAWFGSKTMSHIPCSDLYPFLEDFKLKFDKKKRSNPYRRAIKQATKAAKSFESTSDIDLEDFDVS